MEVIFNLSESGDSKKENIVKEIKNIIKEQLRNKKIELIVDENANIISEFNYKNIHMKILYEEEVKNKRIKLYVNKNRTIFSNYQINVILNSFIVLIISSILFGSLLIKYNPIIQSIIRTIPISLYGIFVYNSKYGFFFMIPFKTIIDKSIIYKIEKFLKISPQFNT